MTSSPSPTWVRSRRCDTNTCVEAALVGDQIAVRNSEFPAGPVVYFSQAEWRAFLGGVEDGDFQFN